MIWRDAVELLTCQHPAPGGVGEGRLEDVSSATTSKESGEGKRRHASFVHFLRDRRIAPSTLGHLVNAYFHKAHIQSDTAVPRLKTALQV